MSNKPVIFVIIPFDDKFLALYEGLKERFTDSFEFTNAGDLDNQQNILKDIVVGIYSADVIIADLTGLNPNVFYELGLAHAMDKKVIIITQDIDELPFDIKSYRVNKYSMLFYEIPQLYAKLEDLLTGAINGNKQFGSPYSDFIMGNLLQKKEDITSMEITLDNYVIGKDTDEKKPKGFLDFIAEIDDATSKMANELHEIQVDMEQMNSEVKNINNEADRFKAKVWDSSADVFAKNIFQKLSQPINTCVIKLKDHVSTISENWNIVEDNYLAVLNDKRIYAKENFESVKKKVENLLEMKNAIYYSNSKIEGAIDILISILGFERRLTKAIAMLIAELQDYLSITNMMDSSIERIISKSKTLELPLEEIDT